MTISVMDTARHEQPVLLTSFVVTDAPTTATIATAIALRQYSKPATVPAIQETLHVFMASGKEQGGAQLD